MLIGLRRALVPAVVAVLGVGIWGVAGVQGVDRPSPSVPGAPQGAQRGTVVTKNLAPLKTYLSRSFDVVPAPAGDWRPMGTVVSVKCPGRQGACIVTAEVHTALSTEPGADIALCPFLDGALRSGQTDCGLWVGSPADHAFASYSYIHTFRVAPGTHTFRLNVYSSADALVSGFSNVYTVYRKNP